MAEVIRAEPRFLAGAEVEPARLPAGLRRIAMVTTWETQCGIADYAADLTRALVDAGLECDTVAIDRQRLRYLTEAELHREFRALAQACAGRDLVHIQHEYGFFAGSYGWGVSLRVFERFLDELRRVVPQVLVTMHTEPVFLEEPARTQRDRLRHLGRRRLWWSLCRRVNGSPQVRILVHSRTTRRRLIDSGLDARRVGVIPQGVPQPREAVDDAARLEARATLGIPEDAGVLGIFGFMSRYKGYNVAVEAVRHLPDNYHLLLLGGPHPLGGDSALEDVLAELAKRPRLRQRVHLTGFVPAARLAALRACVDVCVAPYLTRPRLSSSAALSWALASGRPVIASRIPAFEELAEDGDCLHLVNPERPRELAHAVEQLMADEVRRQTLVDNARAYAAENSWDARAREHLALYAALRAGE